MRATLILVAALTSALLSAQSTPVTLENFSTRAWVSVIDWSGQPALVLVAHPNGYDSAGTLATFTNPNLWRPPLRQVALPVLAMGVWDSRACAPGSAWGLDSNDNHVVLPYRIPASGYYWALGPHIPVSGEMRWVGSMDDNWFVSYCRPGTTCSTACGAPTSGGKGPEWVAVVCTLVIK